MKKIIGLIFSTVGNVGVLLAFLAILALPIFNVLNATKYLKTFEFNWIITAIIAGVGLVCYIFALIGNKVDNSAFEQGAYMKLKRTLINIGGKLFFNGFFIFIYVLILLGYIALGILSLTGQLSVSSVDMFVSAGALILTVSFAMEIYNNYPLRHCPHCGGSYSGGGYSYEEEERSARTDNEGKVHRTSKIRFAFTCPICQMEHVFRKKMATNPESVEKFANNIVK